MVQVRKRGLIHTIEHKSWHMPAEATPTDLVSNHFSNFPITAPLIEMYNIPLHPSAHRQNLVRIQERHRSKRLTVLDHRFAVFEGINFVY